MADTRAHKFAEQWVTNEWLPERFGQSSSEIQLPLSPDGVFNFDAVSEDRQVIANISTSAEKTNRGKHRTAKIQKICSDRFFLFETDSRLFRVKKIYPETRCYSMTPETSQYAIAVNGSENENR